MKGRKTGQRPDGSRRVDYTSRLYARIWRPDHLNINRIDSVLSPKKGEKLLEVGCSRGFLVKHYRRMGVDAVGIDANRGSVDLACSDFVAHHAGDRLKFPDGTFDAAMGIHVIEHIHRLKSFLRQIYRVVKPGGRFFFVYPAEPIRGLYAIYAAAILRQNPREIHCHKLTPRRLRKAFADSVGDGAVEHLQSSFWLLPLPQFGSLFQKK